MENGKTNGFRITVVCAILGILAVIAAAIALVGLGSVKNGSESYGMLTFGIVSLIVIFVVMAAAFIVLVLSPLNAFLKNMHANKPLDIFGAEELQKIGKVYNETFEINEVNRKLLKDREERDALTGVYNSAAYGRYLKQTIESDDEFALVYVEVDHFDSILSQGKDKSDKALQRVANLLRQYFKGDRDYVCRTDKENCFAVILTDIRSANASSVGKRIDKINEKLTNPAADYLVPCSVSVGLAFSDGSADRLDIGSTAREAAKLAMERGRCGYVVLDVEEKEKLKAALLNIL